jgi:chitinase
MTVATMSFMTGPGDGDVTIRMACPHGTDDYAFRASVDDVQAIGRAAKILVAQHWGSFGCTCEPGVLLNREDAVQ